MKYNDDEAEKVISDDDLFRFINEDNERNLGNEINTNSRTNIPRQATRTNGEEATGQKLVRTNNYNKNRTDLKDLTVGTPLTRTSTVRSTTGRDTTGRNTTGRDTTGRNTGGRNTTVRNSTGRNTIGKGINARKKKNGFLSIIASLGMFIFFPIMFLYQEIVFHVWMGIMDRHFLIYTLFAIAFGLGVALLTVWGNKKVNRIIAIILSAFGAILFSAEMVCKTVLATYYQFLSSMDTAGQVADTNYLLSIIQGVFKNIIGILLMFLPMILLIAIGKKIFDFDKKNIKLNAIIFSFAVLFHCMALLSMNLPIYSSDDDLAPKKLYGGDQMVEDQVQRLGVLTMLRLDVKHSIFGVSKNYEEVSNNNVNAPERPTDIAEPVTEPEVTIDTSPNIMNIDFDSLIAASKSDNVKWLNKYFSQVEPTKKNQYTGMFKGYNVIFITLEGFSKYVIDKERTPTLYKMANEGFVFNNFYTPLHYTSTSGGECQNLLGLYPKNGNPISMKETGVQSTNVYFSLGRQLSMLGYASYGFHNNTDMYGRSKSHANLGYNWIYGGNGYDMEKTTSGINVWPQSDLYMMQHTVGKYITSDTPFNVYYMTVSGHMPYNFTGDMIAIRNQDIVKGLKYSETTKAYLAAQQEVEKAMTYLNQKLEEAGIADKTLIVMAADHIPYFDVDVLEELSGQSFGAADIQNLKESDVNFDLYKNSLIIWSASMKEPVKVDKICGQVDILPTVSNLLGLTYDSRLLIGTDILSDSDPLVIFSSRSWLTDVGLYNIYTKTFTKAQGVTYNDEYIEKYVTAMKKVVSNKMDASVEIIESNYYNILFPNYKYTPAS